MKKISILAILLAFAIIGSTACKKDEEITCNLSKTGSASEDMSIEFKAEGTGDGTISTLTYKVGSTTKTVSNPSLPWSVTVSASGGDAVSITASGTTKDGSITVSYDGIGSGSEIKGSDICSHSNS